MSGKVAALAVGRGKYEQKGKKVRGRVMASEPLSGERSDAVKVSETPYPTNGSGKNLAKNTGVKYVFAIILCRILR